jgi:two-component system, chemotaxis family, response regulator Rcp1
MKNLYVLLVEDNEADILLTGEILKQTGIGISLDVVKDGSKALHFVTKKNGCENTPAPDLILLDINLPKKDGKQVLRFLKEDSELRSIPVIMYSSSTLATDILECNRLGAELYLNKPALIEDFADISLAIKAFIVNHFKNRKYN